jgi:DNA mismatch repair protein MutS2
MMSDDVLTEQLIAELKLDLNTIKTWLKNFCYGELAKKKVEELKFTTSWQKIKVLQEQIFEWLSLRTIKKELLAFNYSDITKFVHKLSLTGGFLCEDEWVELKKTIENINHFQKIFNSTETACFYHLRDLSFDIRLNKDLAKEISAVIDDEGKVRSTASPHLYEIREALFKEHSRLRKKLTQFLESIQKNGMSYEEMTLTVRNGRMVIPIKAEYKRKIKGLIHDESSTGQIVFIEPEDAVESNNLIKELEYEEKREIFKILQRLGDKFKPFLADLLKGLDWLSELDLIHAKSELALYINAQKPSIIHEPIINVKNAFHPVLYIHCKENNKKIVPLSLKLNEERQILVISGPNAGGKSVCLKTIGIIQMMLQMGLPVTCDSQSELGIFDYIFVEMGDTQSLENDLSTYSSHLSNLKKLLDKANYKTLFLIDEFGSGTDPEYGGAIAEAILEELLKKKCKGLVNTHYSNLKKFAQLHPNVENACMRFDPDKMEPLYELAIGVPGSSFSLEIARKIGLDPKIIQSAKNKIGESKQKEDQILIDIEKKKIELDQKLKEQERLKKSFQLAYNQYNELNKYLVENKKKYIEQARSEAQQIILNANKLVEKTIKEIKEHKAEKEVTKQLRGELEKTLNDLKAEARDEKNWNDSKVQFSVGDLVKVSGQDALGEVLAIKGDNAEILLGEIKTFIKLAKLERINKYESKESKKTSPKPKLVGINLAEEAAKFKYEYDFRGLKADEAIAALDEIMDKAILLSVAEFKIIHGKGDGILRQVIRKKLKEYKEVKLISDEHPDRGADGVTIVGLK